MAINVLVEHIVSIDRGLDYAGDRKYGADSRRRNLIVCASKILLVITAASISWLSFGVDLTHRFLCRG
jgi:hypothetical protein